MYGNYCGPYWSGGAYQESRDDVTQPVDALDMLCKEHDLAYARNKNLKQADMKFSTEAAKLGWRGKAYGLIVGVQGSLRPDDSITTMTRQKLRGSNSNKNMKTNDKANEKSKPIVIGTAMAPAAVGTLRALSKPIVQNIKNGMLLKHKTFIGAVPGSVAYAANELKCNPGLSSSFPWASKLASRFEKYRFKALTYHYYSVVSTATAGVVSLSFDYDTLDASPVAKYMQAETTPFVEGNMWTSFQIKVPMDGEWRYTRQGDLNNVDYKTYDCGKLVYGTEYAAGTTVVGELYVEYEIELKNPTEPAPIFETLIGTGAIGSPFSSLTTYGTSQPFLNTTSTTFTSQVNGAYLIVICVAGTGLTAIAAPTVSSGTATSIVGTIINSSGVYASRVSKVRVSKGAVITFPVSTGTTVTSTNVYIAECDFDNAIFVV